MENPFLFNKKFNKKTKNNNELNHEEVDNYKEIAKLVKEARIKNNWKWKLNRPLGEIEENLRRFSDLGNSFGRTRK